MLSCVVDESILTICTPSKYKKGIGKFSVLDGTREGYQYLPLYRLGCSTAVEASMGCQLALAYCRTPESGVLRFLKW